MGAVVGIRREDKGPWERRVPITPPVAAELRKHHGVDFLVQPSPRRIFTDDAYREVGISVGEDISPARLVVGVKEIPKEVFLPDTAYMFFSHVIKGQLYNMPMLARLMKVGATLIDYEKVTSDDGKRLIFFGRYAGLAGMIDSLWALGRRLDWEGIANPFNEIQPAHAYGTLKEALATLQETGRRLASEPLPSSVGPLIIGIAGYGHVAGGVKEILHELGARRVAPTEVAGLVSDPAVPRNVVYRTTYREEHLVAPVAPGARFELQEYYQHPERYHPTFRPHLAHLSMLVNCIYWDQRYPRLFTWEDLETLYGDGPQPRLRVLGDISCDVDGAVQCTVRITSPDDPVYVVDPANRQAASGVAGRGPVVLAVDILPAELPRNASIEFAKVLGHFLPAMAAADFSVPYEKLDLPPEIKRAVIVHRGELTPDYRYIEQHLKGQRA